MKKALKLVIIIAATSGSISFGQKGNQEFELSFFGINVYHLTDNDLAYNPAKGYTKLNYEFVRLAYHGNPGNTVGFYSRFTWGGGYIERGILLNGISMPDNMNHEELYIGITFNPMHSSRIWFQLAAGLDRLYIGGVEDFVPSGSSLFVPSLHFTGNSMARLLNNIPHSGTGTLIPGYPAFKRVDFALNIGVSLKLYKGFSMYFDYTPLLTSPIRNDYSFGLTYINLWN